MDRHHNQQRRAEVLPRESMKSSIMRPKRGFNEIFFYPILKLYHLAEYPRRNCIFCKDFAWQENEAD